MLERAVAVRRAVVRVISAERAHRGITLNGLAADGEFNRSTLTRYLYGDTDMPLTALYRIAAALGISPCEILQRAESLIESERTS